MAKETVYGFYKDLPSWAKGVVVIAGILITGYVGFQVYSGIKRRRELKDANRIADDANKELSALKSKGINPTLTPSQLEAYCLKLVEAMNGCGTDEQEIYSVFKAMNNKADVLALISKFGVRYYQPCAASQPVSYSKWLLNDEAFGGNLGTWLEYDLDSSEKAKINSVLKAKNIDYSF